MAGKQADIKVGVITNYDDKGLNQAKTGLAGFSNSIKEADGVGGKFKAGWGSIKESVSANAGAMGIAAGGALVAFGLKAVGAFTETAKAALDLATATGLSTEQASRWIAVGDDFEVSAEALQTGLGKIAKTMDDSKWKQYGIATRDASGAARDTNDILLDSFDVLSRVTNETERARIGQQLFGKGYQSITPILGHTRAEYEKMLGTVEKGQVITAKEAEKAEKFRLAQDNLSDAVHDVTIQIGEQVAQMVPLINILIKFIELTGEAFGPGGLGGGGFRETTDAMRDMRGEIEAAGLDFGDLEQRVIAEGLSVEELTKIVTDATAEYAKLHGELRQGEKSWETQTEWLGKQAEAAAETDRETRKLTEGMKGGTEAFEDAKPPIDNASRALGKFKEAVAGVNGIYDELIGKLDEEDAWAAVNQAAVDLAANLKEAGKDTDLAAQATRDYTRDLAEYVLKTDTIPASKKTEILLAIQDGDQAKIDMLMAEVTKRRTIYLDLVAAGSGDIIAKLGAVGAHAAGGRIPMSEGLSVVGEDGPELISSPGSTVIPAGQTAAMLGGGGGVTIQEVHIHVQTMPTPNELISILGKYKQRNGPGALNGLSS